MLCQHVEQLTVDVIPAEEVGDVDVVERPQALVRVRNTGCTYRSRVRSGLDTRDRRLGGSSCGSDEGVDESRTPP